MTEPDAKKIDPAAAESEHQAIANLRDHQTQLDSDGTMVGVSRQAVKETLAEYERLTRELAEARSSYRCYSCKQVFQEDHGHGLAREHFGSVFRDVPKCLEVIDGKASWGGGPHDPFIRVRKSHYESLEAAEHALTERTTDRDGWMKQVEGMADFLTEREAEIARITKGERQAVQDLADALNANQALEAEIAGLKNAIQTAYGGLEHGDEAHRKWLRDRFDTHFAHALSTPTGAKVMALIESCKRMRDAPIGTESPFSSEFVDAYSLMVANLAALDGGQKDG